jgi:hypothetical protein
MKILFPSLRFALATAGIFLMVGGLNLVQAQSPGSGGPTPAPTAVPIDGGASLLLAAGVGFGLKKLRDHRRR